MKFAMQFIGLTVVYMVIAIGVIYLMAMYYAHKEGGRTKKHFWKIVWNNNTLFFMGIVATIITGVFWITNPGPAVLLPKDLPTPEQRGDVGNWLNHLLHGTNVAAKSVPPLEILDPKKPLPWATGTWFWGWATFWYGLLTFLYMFFALSDELTHFCAGIKAIIKEHRQRGEKGHGGQDKGEKEGHHATGHSLKELVTAELISDIVIQVGKSFITKGKV